MTTFIDGPAQGTTLFLRRAPHYLRVVQGPDGPTQAGTIDALDQLDDTPAANERIAVYEMVSGPTHVHINRRGRHGCAWYRGGAYRLVAAQPADRIVRDTACWRAWVSEQIGKPLAADGSIAEKESTT